jgi:hypothetical protein
MIRYIALQSSIIFVFAKDEVMELVPAVLILILILI